jgi:hypothetical protein
MIDAQRVQTLLTDCFFRPGEDTSAQVVAEGALMTYGFHPERLASHRAEIVTMLAQLPEAFFDDAGGGMSLMAMVADRDNVQWGEQVTADALYVLANALGLARYCMPREMWRMFPGGMPYIVILRTKFVTT